MTPSDTTGSSTRIDIDPSLADEAEHGDCTLGWDTQQLVLVCEYQGEVNYHRLAPNGAATDSSRIYDTAMEPKGVAIAPAGFGPGDSPKVGIIGIEGADLVFVMRDQDGSEMVEPGSIAVVATSTIADSAPQLFWDGDVFQAFWLEQDGSIEQLHRTTLTCE